MARIDITALQLLDYRWFSLLFLAELEHAEHYDAGNRSERDDNHQRIYYTRTLANESGYSTVSAPLLTRFAMRIPWIALREAGTEYVTVGYKDDFSDNGTLIFC
jgi:hypothetical protein